MSRVVVIGSNHAGTAAVRTLLQSGQHEVVVYELNDNISFLGCGMALWIGKQIDRGEDLFYCNVDELRNMGATVYTQTKVNFIDFQKKTLSARNSCGNVIEDHYDKLILATGSQLRQVPIPGFDLENVLYARRFDHAQKAIEVLNQKGNDRVVVVGAGYIGVELAEACVRLGKKVVLIDIESDILSTHFDEAFTQLMRERLEKIGVELALGQRVTAFAGDQKLRQVVTDKTTFDADVAFFCLGFQANVELGQDILELSSDRAYRVNAQQQTSDPDVYAIGDCATVINNANGNDADYIALATNAVRSGILAALNISNVDISSTGVQGSSAICIDGLRLVSTGMSLRAAEKFGVDVLHTDYSDKQLPSFMKVKNPEVKIRIIYRKSDRVVVGAQMASEYDMSAGIHMYSLAIQEKITIDRLKLLDIFFMPHFNQPYNYYTMCALAAP